MPGLADWARQEAAPSDHEIEAVRPLVAACQDALDRLDPDDRGPVEEAIELLRNTRAGLDTTFPVQFRSTRSPRPPRCCSRSSRPKPSPRAMTPAAVERLRALRRADSQAKGAAVRAALERARDRRSAAHRRRRRPPRPGLRRSSTTTPNFGPPSTSRPPSPSHGSPASWPARHRSTGASLRADLENTKAENLRLREHIRLLEVRLSEALATRSPPSSPTRHPYRRSLLPRGWPSSGPSRRTDGRAAPP